MLLFKRLVGDKYCIIEDKFVTIFDRTGRCLEEGIPLSPQYLNDAMKMNYVSVLSSEGRLEVAIINDDIMTRYVSELSPQNCVLKAMGYLKPVCILRRNGKFDGVNFNQAIFVCTTTSRGTGLIDELKLKEVTD